MNEFTSSSMFLIQFLIRPIFNKYVKKAALSKANQIATDPKSSTVHVCQSRNNLSSQYNQNKWFLTFALVPIARWKANRTFVCGCGRKCNLKRKHQSRGVFQDLASHRSRTATRTWHCRTSRSFRGNEQ